MDFFTIFSYMITLAVIVAYINHRFIKMPTTIAIMVSSLVLSLILLIVEETGYTSFEQNFSEAVLSIDFHSLLMNGMLSFLLFAGALNVDINNLRKQKWEITALALVGTMLSVISVGLLCYYVLNWFGAGIGLSYCFLFGALISPTDPIAVLAIFKRIGAPQALTTALEGESLFNDGVGIVIFISLYDLVFGGQQFSLSEFGALFLQQAVGGILYGALVGYITFLLIKRVSSHKIEVLLTVAVTTGGYVFADKIGISGPLAMVVAGIFIGNHGELFSIEKHTSIHLEEFWEIIDEILNAVLFVLIGFELLAVEVSAKQFYLALITIPIVLFARFLCVGSIMHFFKRKRSYHPHITKIIIWGGLRGGLAVALALSLPIGSNRDLILTMTYFVVVFTILVQGMTIKPLVKHAVASKKRLAD